MRCLMTGACLSWLSSCTKSAARSCHGRHRLHAQPTPRQQCLPTQPPRPVASSAGNARPLLDGSGSISARLARSWDWEMDRSWNRSRREPRTYHLWPPGQYIATPGLIAAVADLESEARGRVGCSCVLSGHSSNPLKDFNAMGEKVAAAVDKKVAVVVDAGVAAGEKKVAAAAAAEGGAAVVKRHHYRVPSDDYFNLCEDPTDREELRACFTEFAALVDQWNAEAELKLKV